MRDKIAHVSVTLSDSENNICATGNIYYYLFSLEESIKNYNYPEDYSCFFDN